jgi:hypothetical protein
MFLFSSLGPLTASSVNMTRERQNDRLIREYEIDVGSDSIILTVVLSQNFPGMREEK